MDVPPEQAVPSAKRYGGCPRLIKGRKMNSFHYTIGTAVIALSGFFAAAAVSAKMIKVAVAAGSWNADRLGNIRAVVHVGSAA